MAYPTTLDALAANKGDTTDAIAGSPTGGSAGDHAAHHNALATAINAVETELGTDPSGTFTTVGGRFAARLTCRKTADQTLSSTTNNVAITDLTLPIATAGLDYYFRFVVIYNSSAAANGIRLALSGPALTGYVSAQVSIYGRIANAAGAATPPLLLYPGYITAFGTVGAALNQVQSDAVIATGTNYPAIIEGIVSNPSATGSIQVLGANDVSTASGNVVKRGSYGEIYIN